MISAVRNTDFIMPAEMRALPTFAASLNTASDSYGPAHITKILRDCCKDNFIGRDDIENMLLKAGWEYAGIKPKLDCWAWESGKIDCQQAARGLMSLANFGTFPDSGMITVKQARSVGLPV